MAWYRPDDYDRIRAIMTDRNRLPATYAGWLLSAEQVANEIERSGVNVDRILLLPDEFAAWCTVRDLECNGAARSRYANEAHEG